MDKETMERSVIGVKNKKGATRMLHQVRKNSLREHYKLNGNNFNNK